MLDPLCAEAAALLCDRRLLSANAAAKLSDQLLETLGERPETLWLRDFYTVAFEAHGGLTAQRDARALRSLHALSADAAALGSHGLANSADVLAVRAEVAYARSDYEGARQLAERALELDARPDSGAMFVLLATLVELGEPTALFAVAHRLVADYPRSAVAWHAVGCYYLARGAFDAARQHFRRATTIDASLGVAWLGFGRAFGALAEHDQAVAAYRAASRLLVGSHVPPLAIAQELLRDGNLPLAREFVAQASTLCQSDPLLWNEAGVIAFRRGRYCAAMRLFVRSLTLACRAGSAVPADMVDGDDADDNEQHQRAVDAALLPSGAGDSELENEVLWAKSGVQDCAVDDVDMATFHAQEERALQFANSGPRSTVLRFESTLINLGHCHRKLRNYARARVCYHAALRLCPNSAHTLSCIGVACHLNGELEKAIDFYHSSLAIARGDSFTSDMLARAIEQFSNDMSLAMLAMPLPSIDANTVSSSVSAAAMANELSQQQQQNVSNTNNTSIEMDDD
jgi:tetratricopeptide (TPR) repeat protein